MFRSVSGTRALAYAPAYYVKDLPYTKYWIMGPDYAYGHSMAEMFVEKLKEIKPGFVVLGESWPKFGTTDFTPYISAIMAAKPEAIYSSVWGADWVAWLKQAKPRWKKFWTGVCVREKSPPKKNKPSSTS